MTAARHFDECAAVPGHDEIVAMAPAMLVEACDGQAEATDLAARWTRKTTARSARAINARDASAA